MTTDKPDPLLDSARRERAKRWAGSNLHGYPTLNADEETEETLAAVPKQEPPKKRSTEQNAT